MSELGQVVALHIAAESGAATQAMERVELVAGRGIVGDRYYGSRHRHVSVQDAAALAMAAAEAELSIEPGTTRRNITLSAGPIPTEPGSIIEIARCRLEVVRIAAPCRVMDETIGVGARAALRRRGGVICRILEGGLVEIGDQAAAPSVAQ